MFVWGPFRPRSPLPSSPRTRPPSPPLQANKPPPTIHPPPLRAALLKAEEEWVASTCATIAAHKPDLVVTEKGLSDLAAHFLTKVRPGV